MDSDSYKTTLQKLLKSTFKEKHNCGTKKSKICIEREILFFWNLKISKKCKILQQNNYQMRLDKSN